MAKKFLFLHRRAPHGSIYVLEALEVVMVAAAFDQQVALAFIDDGVFALKSGQALPHPGFKSPVRTYPALGDFDVNRLYVERESLERRGLHRADLIEPLHEDQSGRERPSLMVVSSAEMMDILEDHDVILNF